MVKTSAKPQVYTKRPIQVLSEKKEGLIDLLRYGIVLVVITETVKK